MGIYFNPGANLFLEALNSQIYVDKTGLIEKLNMVVNTQQKYVCISRPRRFGKSMAANMICAYYDRTVDPIVFKGLKIGTEEGMRMQGKFNVLRINIQEFLSRTSSMDELLGRLQKRLIQEIRREYPDVEYFDPDHLSDVMDDVHGQKGSSFVIVIDEWDCVFREYPHDTEAQRQYLDFLRDWLKDKAYIALAYMTGILPIKKYGTHSALNMFSEFSMEHPDQFAEYVGFTEGETKELCDRYGMDFSECQAWYDGYSFPEKHHVYNPKSVVDAMLRHRFGSYWINTETYEALKIYIDLNEDGLRDAIIALMGGGKQQINTGTFENDMTSLHSADDVMTLLIHLGYLGYDAGTEEVFIPNNEIMREFVNATEKGEEWDAVSNAIHKSDELLQAVWNEDEEKVAAGVEAAHFETSILQYNDENALSYVLSLAFYSARRYYTLIREFPSGKGYADLAFLPRPLHIDKPAMIIELKCDDSVESGLHQIRDKHYDTVLNDYEDNLLLVAISYNRKTKEHNCKIEKS